MAQFLIWLKKVEMYSYSGPISQLWTRIGVVKCFKTTKDFSQKTELSRALDFG